MKSSPYFCPIYQKQGEDFAKFCGLLRIYELLSFHTLGYDLTYFGPIILMKLKVLHACAQIAHFLGLSFTKNTYKKNVIMEHIFVA